MIINIRVPDADEVQAHDDVIILGSKSLSEKLFFDNAGFNTLEIHLANKFEAVILHLDDKSSNDAEYFIIRINSTGITLTEAWDPGFRMYLIPWSNVSGVFRYRLT